MGLRQIVRICTFTLTLSLPFVAAGQEDETVEFEELPQAESEEQLNPDEPEEQLAPVEPEEGEVATPSYAPEDSQHEDFSTEPRREHKGFYIRGTLGLGYGSGSETFQGNDFTSSGFGLLLSAAAGGAIVENLILNADLFVAYIFKPSVTLNGAELGQSEATQNATGLGAGLTYFFMPVNLYLACSAGLGFVTVQNQGYGVSTDMGWGLNALVGKEWWVAERSGVGVAAQFMYVSAPEVNVDARFNMYFVGLVATVSYD